MLAHPLETIHRKRTPAYIDRIIEVVAERKIDTLVVGLPVLTDGTEGTAAKTVRDVIGQLRPKLPPHVEIVTVDEFYSTATAQEHLRASGRTARQSKNIIDQAAACVILQNYLDSGLA